MLTKPQMNKYFQPYIPFNIAANELLAISNGTLYITKYVKINSNKFQDICNIFQCFMRLRAVGPHL